MGDWFSDLLDPSTWNINPAYSPTFQQTVVPVLNVAGSIVGVPTAGTILSTAITPTSTITAPTLAPPPLPASITTFGTIDETEPNYMPWLIGGGVVVAGLAGWALYSRAGKGGR